jgi:hypothetical protein
MGCFVSKDISGMAIDLYIVEIPEVRLGNAMQKVTEVTKEAQSIGHN